MATAKNQSKNTPTKLIDTAPAYKVEHQIDSFNGIYHWLDFVNGVAVFDLKVIAEKRSEWCQWDGNKQDFVFNPIPGVEVMGEIKTNLEHHGFKFTKISWNQAQLLRESLNEARKKMSEESEVEESKGKKKGEKKVKGKESGPLPHEKDK
jgi:hypothetical protein